MPGAGVPSTHILKPAPPWMPYAVENEAFCMRLARPLGMDVAPVEATKISNRKLTVVDRYDRIVDADGSVYRLHQEDLCQAHGLEP